MSEKLKGKTALVTGGANGIGKAVAKRFALEGANVVIADINKDAGEGSAKDIQAEGGSVYFHHCDISEPLDIRNLLCITLERFKNIDVLVNNAGVVANGDFLDVTHEEFSRVLRVNLHGTFLVSQAAAKQMVEQTKQKHPPGCIINVTSINAVVALASQVPYTASKGAINQLTKVMALSLAPHGIRVNAIGPGSINTDMVRTVNEDAKALERLLSRTPLGRIGEPEEIAGIAAFLASDDASYITGEIIYADGGRLALNYTVPVKE
ncbi:MAG: SDR family NAD(P)-dependent oxidoreductase [Hyphomicrobiales bacterium]|nr:SDR family NAD(P)-dependent oxidoreductase [Hyphomicrobiales bacterium]